MADETEELSASTSSGTTPGLTKIVDALNASFAAQAGAKPKGEAPAGGEVVVDKAAAAKTEEGAGTKKTEVVTNEKTGNPLGDDIPKSIRGKEAAEDFRRIKAAAIAANARAAEIEATYQKKIADYEAKLKTSVDPKIIEEARAEAQKYKAIVEMVAVEYDPKVQQELQSEVNRVIGELATATGDEGKAKEIAKALDMPESPYKRELLKDLMEDMDEFAKDGVFHANRELQRLNTAYNQKKQNSSKTIAELQASREASFKEQQAAHSKVFEDSLAKVADEKAGMPAFQKKTGDDAETKAWNEQVETNKALARHIYEGNFESDQERADAAFWAASSSQILQSAIAANKRVAELEAQLAKITAASPGMEVGRERKGEEQPQTFSGRVAAAFAGRA